MSTAATVKHRHQTALANTGADVSATVWNDSLVIASAAADGAIFVKDSAQPDGWGLVTALPPVNGGTGLTTYAVGDLLYASGAGTLAKLADVAVGSVLVSGGVGAPPVYSANLTLATITSSSGIVLTGGNISGATGFALLGQSGNNTTLGDSGGRSVLPLVDNTTPFGSASARWQTGYFGTALVVGTNPAAGGGIRLPNATYIGARKFDNTGDVQMMTLDTNNAAQIGDPGFKTLLNGSDIQWGKALVALGGGAAPTVGTIGGSGPAVAAQNTWLRVLDSTGAACWLPVWK